MKKTELIPYYKKAKQLLSQFEEVKILYVQQVVNARADALKALAASLSIQDGEVCHITISRRKLLTPLSETLPKSISE